VKLRQTGTNNGIDVLKKINIVAVQGSVFKTEMLKCRPMSPRRLCIKAKNHSNHVVEATRLWQEATAS
jgi:hypothetical protein